MGRVTHDDDIRPGRFAKAPKAADIVAFKEPLILSMGTAVANENGDTIHDKPPFARQSRKVFNVLAVERVIGPLQGGQDIRRAFGSKRALLAHESRHTSIHIALDTGNRAGAQQRDGLIRGGSEPDAIPGVNDRLNARRVNVVQRRFQGAGISINVADGGENHKETFSQNLVSRLACTNMDITAE